MRNEKKNYDERQVSERGKAYKYAYFSAMISSMLIFIIKAFSETAYLDHTFSFVFVVWSSATVFAVTAIKNDAYDRMNDSSSGKIVFGVWSICGIFIICSGLSRIFKQNITVDRINNLLSSMTVGVGMIICSVTYFVKLIKNKRLENKLEG